MKRVVYDSRTNCYLLIVLFVSCYFAVYIVVLLFYLLIFIYNVYNKSRNLQWYAIVGPKIG